MLFLRCVSPRPQTALSSHTGSPRAHSSALRIAAAQGAAAQPTLVSEADAVPPVSPSVTLKDGINYYADTRMNFTFFPTDPSQHNTNLQVTLVGNRIYLTHENQDYHGAPFIELFAKNPTDTIQQAIQKTVLAGYNLADCPIGPAAAPRGFVPVGWSAASITYAQLNGYLGDAAPTNFDPSKCPEDYVSSSTVSYFEVDPAHPDVLIYLWVNNGLYPADALGSAHWWFQTLHLTH